MIVFDIGGPKMRMAYSEDGKKFKNPHVLETPKSYEEISNTFLAMVKEVAGEREIKNIVGGISRAVIADYQKFKTDLQKVFTAEVVVENDAAMVGLGEANFGAGRGFEIVAYITVSTGVGGARIVAGKIDEKFVGFEPGKQIMNVETGENLEDFVSGKALQRRTGQHPKEIRDKETWIAHAKFLAMGLHNIIVEWSPDVVVLGGSMITGDPAIPLPVTESYLKEIMKIFPKIPPIKKAELGDFGGLWGGLAYLKK